MLKGTLKKSRQNSAGEERRKTFIVTESGVVEEEEEEKKPTRTRKVSLWQKTKPSLMPDGEASSGTSTPSLPPSKAAGMSNEDTEKMFREYKQVSQMKNKFVKVAQEDAKSKLKLSSDKEMRERIRNAGNGDDVDEIKATFYGKKKDLIMSQFLASKAIAIMSTERRKRREAMGNKGRIGSLLAVGKFKSRVEKRRESVAVKDSGVVNSQVLIGLGKFKKLNLKLKAKKIDEEKQTLVEEDTKISVKSLAAAGKFKNRRYNTKKENTTKQTMGAFLSWFGGSQALDRIIKLERMGIPDDKILMEINYMVKKETARQKQKALRLGPEFVTKVDEDMAEILECVSFIHSWIRNQALFKTVDIGEDENDEDVVIHLTTSDPQHCANIVRFNQVTMEFENIKLKETMIDHLDIESTSIHRESKEGQKQIQTEIENMMRRQSKAMKDIILEEEEEQELKEKERRRKRRGKKNSKNSKRKSSVGTNKKGRMREDSTVSDTTTKKTNQFTYVERSTQTYNKYQKDRDMQTEPPKKLEFRANLSQWVIYDRYVAHEEAKERAEETESKNDDGSKILRKRFLEPKEEDQREITNKKMIRCAKILERMVNQNNFDEIALDYSFYEDAADEQRQEGTLLPLWQFSHAKAAAAGMEVTSLCWNTKYKDLFAVGFGSYNFYNRLGEGVVAVFSLKNPTYPEYCCWTRSPVSSVDLHPTHCHMVCVGLANGNVCVYNLQSEAGTSAPSHESSALRRKHGDIVTHVKWAPDDLDGYLNFYSVSGDGRVINWTLVKCLMRFTEKLYIKLDLKLHNIPPYILHEGLTDGGTCLAFKPDNEMEYLVGTEEGDIHLCSTEYASEYLRSYKAHTTPVNSIQWSTFLPDVFISCASEFVIKIWSKTYREPLLTFDLGVGVGDVSWSPYSSTVFAAVSQDGKVHVYDLYLNKYKPVCVQQIVPRKRGRLNHLAFNPTHPVIIVGDSEGTVHSLKLSPNLRKQSRDVKIALANKNQAKAAALEIKKLEVLLAQVRDPGKEEDSEEVPDKEDIKLVTYNNI